LPEKEKFMAIVTLPLPITLLNGTVADAGEVMTDLNAIASNVNANAAKNGVNDDITSLTALISIAPGLTISDADIVDSDIIQSRIDALTTGITQPLGTNNTTLATTAFVAQTAFSNTLPAQLGNAGKYLRTDGTNAFWAAIPPNPEISYRFGAF
jgi:hypothetical protein